MAEQEVIKHTKKIFKVWSNKEHSLWHKLKEFLVEVFIIVFAVTISIWFHNRSEHAHQQEDVKQFLLGLKSDLQKDLAEMKNDRDSYVYQGIIFRYITSMKLNQHLNDDTLKKYEVWIYNTTGLNPNNGRFEGFKSAGKIGQIENEDLQNDIMDLYQEDIVSVLASTDNFVMMKQRFLEYMNKNKKRLTDSTSNVNTVLLQDEAQNICIPLGYPRETIDRYDKCMAKANKIISEINKEYDLNP